jgi:hypothetical protein
MFQKNRNPQTNKARPKRQNTLPDEIQRAPQRARDQSIVTSSLATMRESSNGSARATPHQNEYTDRGVQTKRNKQYLHQMYRSNDQVNESPTRLANASNLSSK